MRTNAHPVWFAAFLAVLWLCFAGTWLGWGQSDSGVGERRALAPWPRINRTFPEGLGLYVRDHFGFRGWLVTLNAMIRVKLLRTSPTPDVVLGEQGFLFFAATGPDSDIGAWVSLFERRAAWLAARGIPLVVTVAPDKETVYPEMIPGSALRIAAGKSRLDRFLDALRQQPGITVIDLRPVLISHKTGHLTYFKTDTHWSSWGAYWAYREILPAVARDAIPVELSKLQMGTAQLTFDLNRMLGFGQTAPEAVETFAPPPGGPPVAGGQDDLLMTSETAYAGRRLLFLHDSFGAALMPFLSRHFSRIYAPNGWAFDGSTVLRERPEVVLIELVERRLNDPPPVDTGLGQP